MVSFNLEKEEKKAYREILVLLKKSGISGYYRKEILNQIYRWSELAIEMEQRHNK